MRIRTIFGAVLTLAFASAGIARAHFGERTDSLWGFVSRSDVIVIGVVLDTHRFEEKGHTTLPGAIRLEVEETLIGDVRPAEVGIRIEGVHQPLYGVGERVLVFAERRDGGLRSLQSRSEKIAAGAAANRVLATVSRYVAVREREQADERQRALTALTLELLQNPEPRLHQDAVFDLSRKELLDPWLSDDAIGSLGSLALAPTTPLVVREGVTHKLGVLLAAGRESARTPLTRLALEPENPAVRVGALNALRAARRRETVSTMIAALDAENAHVRRAALEGIAVVGDEDTVPALANLIHDPDVRVRFAAIRALVRLEGPAAEKALAALRQSDDPDLRRALELASMGTKTPKPMRGDP